MTQRTYLAVPFSERLDAKRAGARFDGDRKAWYAERVTEALRRWLPAEPTPLRLQVDPRADFSAVMRDVGCMLGGQHPIMDGLPHRVATDGDKRGKRAGFYVLHDGPVPWGYVLNHRTGESASWNAARDRPLSEQERANLRATTATQQAHAEALREQRQYQTALQAGKQLSQLRHLSGAQQTLYLKQKGILSRPGLYASKDGTSTYVPMQDIRDRLWSLQTIAPDGDKRYMEGGRVSGCFHVLGGCRQLQSAGHGTLVLAEGYATAATVLDILAAGPDPVNDVTGIAAFHASNLPRVAESLRRRFPRASIVVAADDDRANAINAGRRYALQAAERVSGLAVFPPFTPGHPDSLSDWNDLDQHSLDGYDREDHRRALREQVRALQRGPRADRHRALEQSLARDLGASPRRAHREHTRCAANPDRQVRDLDEEHHRSR